MCRQFWYSQGIGSNERRSLDDQIELAPGRGASVQNSMVNSASSSQELCHPQINYMLNSACPWSAQKTSIVFVWTGFYLYLYTATCYLLIQSFFNPLRYRFSMWCCPTRLSTLAVPRIGLEMKDLLNKRLSQAWHLAECRGMEGGQWLLPQGFAGWKMKDYCIIHWFQTLLYSNL